MEETGNTGLFLEYDSDMDEGSDKEDHEAIAKDQCEALRQEDADRMNFIEAVSNTAALRDMTTEVERARMQMEDMRSYMCR